MTDKPTIPYTSDDLRYIADRIDEVTVNIQDADEIPEGSWIWGLKVDIFDEAGQPVGQIRPHGDGWLGFYPYAIENEDNA